jgi:hypothetical protein
MYRKSFPVPLEVSTHTSSFISLGLTYNKYRNIDRKSRFMRVAYFDFTTVSRCFTAVPMFLSRKSEKEGGFITYFECG